VGRVYKGCRMAWDPGPRGKPVGAGKEEERIK